MSKEGLNARRHWSARRVNLSSCHVDALVEVTDVRFERILRRAGWPMARFVPSMRIGKTKALADRLPISESAQVAVREVGQLQGLVLATRSADPMVA